MIESTVIRFVCVGVVNTLAGYAIILVAQFVLGLHPVASNALGYLGGFVVSFVLHRSFTFRSKGSVHRQLSGFAAAAMLCWSLNMLVLHLGLRMAGWLPALAQAVAVSSYTVLFFALTRYAVFHEEKRHGI